MKLKKKIAFAFLFIVALILFLNTSSYAGTQSWNSLDYDVTINADGSMDVIETWDVSVSQTNTMFKSFDIGGDNYKINNAKVTEVKNGREIPLEDIKEQQYHVEQGHYYGLMIDSSTYEIAWHVGLDNSSGNRIYKMYYTVDNAVKIYNDCTELYWKFLSTDNVMPGRNVTGTIRLPKEVSDIEKLRVWAHGNYNGDIAKESNDTVTFSLNNLNSYEMIEVRVVTEENIYNLCQNKYNENYLDEILEEEMQWAEEANKERERAKNSVIVMRFAMVIVAVANVFIFIVCLSKYKKYKAIREELQMQYDSGLNYDYEYFRDIPDEKNATPAKAVYMYNFKKNASSMQSKISKIFSATMLNLSLKGLIAFETVNEKEVRITRTSIKEYVKLSEDEQMIYDLLKDAMLGKDSITPKEFSKYASKEYDSVYIKLNRLEDIVKSLIKAEGKISDGKLKIVKQWNSKFGLYFILAILSTMFVMIVPALTLGLFLLAHACRKNSNCISILTDTGLEEVAMWKGLKKYMEDYSMLSDKLVPDIVLWEKYLVYATAFGISKKVIDQLKAVHPEMFMEANDSGFGNYAYWHMMTNSSFGNNAFDDFSKGLEKVYSSAQSAYSIAHSSSSSGSGGGGGFSGGGGGRRWRRKLWRPLKFLESKIVRKEIFNEKEIANFINIDNIFNNYLMCNK